jgi:hypothetical protein
MSSLILAQKAAPPATPAASKARLYVTTDSPPRFYMVNPDGTITRVSTAAAAFSTATVAAGYAVDTYLAGTKVLIAKALPQAGTSYYATFDMVKTGAGTAAPVLVLRIGTLGTVADAAILTFTFGVGTAVIDSAVVEVWAHYRTVGAAAVLVGLCRLTHALAATGLTTTGASGNAQLAVVSAGFDSTIAAQSIGLSFNGGASFSGTNTIAEAQMING